MPGGNSRRSSDVPRHKPPSKEEKKWKRHAFRVAVNLKGRVGAVCARVSTSEYTGEEGKEGGKECIFLALQVRKSLGHGLPFTAMLGRKIGEKGGQGKKKKKRRVNVLRGRKKREVVRSKLLNRGSANGGKEKRRERGSSWFGSKGKTGLL